MKLLLYSVAQAALASISSTQVPHIPHTSPVCSKGNNGTIVAPGEPRVDGTNDAVFDWGGSLNTSIAGTMANATLTSDAALLGDLWRVHDETLSSPGILDWTSPAGLGGASVVGSRATNLRADEQPAC
jgi:hypothetical protein